MDDRYTASMFARFRKPATLPSPDDALPGRATPMRVPARHHVNGAPLVGPWPDGTRTLVIGMGCFWGAEKAYWSVPGVISTAVGYAGGQTPNPTYEEVCSGQTGHTEAVLVAFDPEQVSDDQLLRLFWEHHDPTQGMRQGNDVGTQYRSAVYWLDDAQREAAERTRHDYQAELTAAGYGVITTQIAAAETFFYAEDDHQQYLAKNPGGYCPDHGTGVACPVGLGVRVAEA